MHGNADSLAGWRFDPEVLSDPAREPALLAAFKTEEDVANYLTLVVEENDMGEFTHALGIVARARGMSAVAEKSGLTREALYKALRPSSQPRFDTIYKVCHALGVRLVAQSGPAHV